jgi:hypothetical protein
MRWKIYRNWLTVMLGIVVLTLPLPSAEAQRDDGLPMRDFSGTWTIHQDNNFVVTMELQQSGSEITGKASYPAGRKGIMRGTVRGRAWLQKDTTGQGGNKDQFEVEITWHQGSGIYKGYTPGGRPYLVGETWPKGNPAGKVKWYSAPAPGGSGFPRRK